METCTSCGGESQIGLLSGLCPKCDKVAGDAFVEAIWLSGVMDDGE